MSKGMINLIVSGVAGFLIGVVYYIIFPTVTIFTMSGFFVLCMITGIVIATLVEKFVK